MRVEYEDDDLQRLAKDASYLPKGLGADVARAYRKKIQLLEASIDDRDLRSMKSLHLEKLAGDRKGLHSIRLNHQRRLILRLRTDEDRVVVVIELVDYH